jgi:hypothetical protein
MNVVVINTGELIVTVYCLVAGASPDTSFSDTGGAAWRIAPTMRWTAYTIWLALMAGSARGKPIGA